MKILYVTSLSGRRINGFMRSAILASQRVHAEFHMACNMDQADAAGYAQDCMDYGIQIKHIPFERNPLSIRNRKAFAELLNYMKEERFDAVHCNTPVGGLIGRLCAVRVGVKHIIYQAHGFHFWKGAPIKNWLLYYPVERMLACFTDLLITINHEDFHLAQKKLRAKQNLYIPGVGVDISRFSKPSPECRQRICEELKIPHDAKILLSVGELNQNKNQQMVLHALRLLPDENVYYILCGDGEWKDKLADTAAACGIEKRIRFAGYRNDICDFYAAADLFVFPSFREGIPAVVMEAIAMRIPVAASRIRGVVDLLPESQLLFSPADANELAGCIKAALHDPLLCQSETHRNWQSLEPFLLDNVVRQYADMYGSMNEMR